MADFFRILVAISADDALLLEHTTERANVFLRNMSMLDLALEYKRDDLVGSRIIESSGAVHRVY